MSTAMDFALWAEEVRDPHADESSPARPGDAIVHLMDGVPVILRADRYILVAEELWREMGGTPVIVLDPVSAGGAGLHRYRHIGERARGARLFVRVENVS